MVVEVREKTSIGMALMGMRMVNSFESHILCCYYYPLESSLIGRGAILCYVWISYHAPTPHPIPVIIPQHLWVK